MQNNISICFSHTNKNSQHNLNAEATDTMRINNKRGGGVNLVRSIISKQVLSLSTIIL
ncbi:hypothetical protein [Helicobacter bilis]|uniref:hypothetical protein n=1 Tax=Helicobacter bilis TaxID=37372 RepID=UPI0013156760|nr:hypothetical protein [Helicobacter bilis]